MFFSSFNYQSIAAASNIQSPSAILNSTETMYDEEYEYEYELPENDETYEEEEEELQKLEAGVIATPFDTSIDVYEWQDMVDAMLAAVFGDEIEFVLRNDITDAGTVIVIPSEVAVTLRSYENNTFAIYQHTIGQRHFSVSGGTLNLHNVRLTRDLSVVSSASIGGGVNVLSGGGYLYMFDGSEISYSRNSGVAVGADSTFNMEGGTIRDNTAVEGGGLTLSDATFNMTGGTIRDNVAIGSSGGGWGGGINATGGTIYMSDGLIYGNESLHTSVATHSGGISIQSGTIFDMTGGTIENNRSNSGGAMRVGFGSVFNMSGDAAIINNTAVDPRFGSATDQTVIGQSAGGDGGGLFVLNATVNMTGGRIEGNTGRWHGGGVLLQHRGDVTGPDVLIADAIFNMSGDAVIRGNHASYAGGGICVIGQFANRDRTVFNMSSGIIENNTSGRPGGGAFVDAAVFNLSEDAIIRNNTAGVNANGNVQLGYPQLGSNTGVSWRSGGGFYLHNIALMHMYGGTIEGNRATDNGGGIYVCNPANLYMFGGTVGGDSAETANRAPLAAGVYVWNGFATMTGGRIVGNAAEISDASNPLHGSGGGVGVGRRTFTMRMPESGEPGYGDSQHQPPSIYNNTAERNGGGVFVFDASVVLGANPAIFTAEVGSIINNHAEYDGGGIFTQAYDYSRIISAAAYVNVITSEYVVFGGNTAGNGSFTPPNNWDITNIRGDGESPSIAAHQLHQLNNYDVNFRRLDLTKTANVDGADVDDEIIYSLTVVNPFTDPLTGNYEVRDQLNTDFVEFIDGTLSVTRDGDELVIDVDFSYSVINGLITVTLYDLPADSTTIITFEVLVLEEAAWQTIVNVASLHAPGDVDGMPSLPVEIPVGTLLVPTITKAANVTTATVGSEIEYTITVSNENPISLSGEFVVIDELDTDFVEFIDGSLSVTLDGDELVVGTDFSYTVVDGLITVTLYGLQADSDKIITFGVLVLEEASGQTIVNQASLYVPNDEDGIMTPPVEVPVAPLLGPTAPTIRKTANVTSATVGSEIEYTITVGNQNPNSLTGEFIVRDELNTNFVQFLPGTLSVTRNNTALTASEFSTNFTGGVLYVTLNDLPPESNTVITFRVRVLHAAAGQTILNAADLEAPELPLFRTPPVTVTVPQVSTPPPGGGGGGGSWLPAQRPAARPTPPAEAELLIPFTESHYAYLIGDDRGLIRPHDSITRGEVATIFFRLITDEFRAEMWTQQNSFSDVELNHWFNNAISTMSNARVLHGMPDGSFQPTRAITRAEFAAVISRFTNLTHTGDNLFPDIQGHWAAANINAVAQMGWVVGFPDGTFAPNQNITRAEVAAIVNRILVRHPETVDDLLQGMIIWPDNMDTSAWFYLDLQEATNSHNYVRKSEGSIFETWTELIANPDWASLERPDSRPW